MKVLKENFKVCVYLKRILRQAPYMGGAQKNLKGNSKRLSKFLIRNSTNTNFDKSGLSMVAPQSTIATNMTVGPPLDYLQSRNLSAISRHTSLVAVLVIMSLFLVITISTTGLILAFCKKKNTVFALQKCEEDSEYELDDMENTDIEMCDDEISPKLKKVRSRTCPSFTNINDSDFSAESPSREPLVRRNSWKILNENFERKMLPRSLTINVLENVNQERTNIESIDDCSSSADGIELEGNSHFGVLVDVCSRKYSSDSLKQEFDTMSLNLQASEYSRPFLE